jgi:hypothetical protein
MFLKTVLLGIRVHFQSFSLVPCENSLQDFNAKVGRENILKLTIRNDDLHQDSNDNGVLE